MKTITVIHNKDNYSNFITSINDMFGLTLYHDVLIQTLREISSEYIKREIENKLRSSIVLTDVFSIEVIESNDGYIPNTIKYNTEEYHFIKIKFNNELDEITFRLKFM